MRRSVSAPPQTPVITSTRPAGRRRADSIERLGAAVVAVFARGPVVGPTTEQQLRDAIPEVLSIYRGREDQYYQEKHLDESSEGQCSLMRSASTGQVFVVKHTKKVPLCGSHRFEADDTKEWKYPNEARILRNTLNPHRNILNILDVFGDEANPGRYHIWSEYCSGGDLLGQVDYWWYTRRAIVPEQFFLHVIVSLANALAYAHWGLRAKRGGKYTQDANHKSIIHGDVKMENVFLRWSGLEIGGMPEVVLGDWGCARPVDKKGSNLGIGTPYYGAPEDHAIHGDVAVTEASWATYCKAVDNRIPAVDMYGLGHVVYMIAAKDRRPWPIAQCPKLLTISREYGTPGLRQLAQSCLVVDREQRGMVNFDQNLGLLPAINDLRETRNGIVQARRPLDALEWLQKPKLLRGSK